jgi:hypothetical protein
VATLDAGVEVPLTIGADAFADDPLLGIERRVAEMAGAHGLMSPRMQRT